MRSAIFLTLLLAGLMWIAVRVDVAYSRAVSANTDVVETAWRRTQSGWERVDSWPNRGLAVRPRFGEYSDLLGHLPLPHPAVAAMLLLLGSLFCLFAFAPASPTADTSPTR